ncbi:hypothetical protein JCM10213_001047 [Rhodosporidiobolus nylandii]
MSRPASPARAQPDASEPSAAGASAVPQRTPASRAVARLQNGTNSEDEDDPDDTFGLRERASPLDDNEVDENNEEKGVGSEERAKKPFFFPPLWLARRTRVMEELRKEEVTSVADLGCGSGALLSLLSLPAYHLDQFPSASSPSSPSAPRIAKTHQEKRLLLATLPPPKHNEKELHLRRLLGVDIDEEACFRALQNCQPSPRPFSAYGGEGGPPDNGTRWAELKIEVYKGGVEVYNEAIEGVEAVVMNEVIEHLTPAALARLPGLIFEVYKPRLAIFTTPTHEFNPYFPPPSRSSRSSSAALEQEESHLYPDPTGSTSRVFRDPTHLREFTSAEFRCWAEEVHDKHAGREEYDFSFTGVGSLAGYWGSVSSYSVAIIPFPPPAKDLHPALKDHSAVLALPEDPRQFFATQIAIFRRRDPLPNGPYPAGVSSKAEERFPRSPRPTPLPFFSGSSSPSLASSTSSPAAASHSRSPSYPTRHELAGSLSLPTHPSLSPAPSTADIRSALRALFTRERRAEMSLADVWRLGTGPRGVRELVGGRVAIVPEALVEDEEWELERLEGEEGGRERRGMEGLLLRWTAYEPPSEEEEGGRYVWSDDDEGEEPSREEGEGVGRGEDDGPLLQLEEDGGPVPETAAVGYGGWGAPTAAWGDAPVWEKEKQENKEQGKAPGGWANDEW